MSNLIEIKRQLSDPKALVQFKAALPSNISPDRFARVAMTAINNAPDIANCSKESVFTSLLKCAQDGLLPDNREAALVKYGNVAQYMPMVYGLIKRMRNSGEISTVNAYCVYEHDEFSYEIINGEELIKHVPKIRGDRGVFILVYCVVSLKDGGRHVEVMLKSEVDKTRAASRSGNSESSPWAKWYDEMAKKAVIHRAAKRVPTSSDIEDLMQRDVKVTLNGSDEDIKQEPSLIDNLNAVIDAEITTESENTNA